MLRDLREGLTLDTKIHLVAIKTIWPWLQAVVVKVKPGNGQSLDEADTNWGNGFVWSINFIIVFIFKYVSV